MKAFYYYSRDDKNRPIITKCFVTDGQTYARGIAVFSIDDNPCKKTGRRIAYSRAMASFYRQKTIGGHDVKAERFFPKCEFMPKLNAIECKFMEIVSP